jgi:UDP-glucuronate 4-epimerase
MGEIKNILVTGIAGFIGTHLQKALQDNFLVSGIDNLSVSASHQRLKTITATFIENSIHSNFIDTLETKPEIVVHLAAETGISGSLTNPALYFHQNVEGTFNVLEQCRKNGVKHLIYASSSSVYEPNTLMSENAPHDKQLSFYGTSKRMTELMVENYCRQFGITAIGLRFFTVYGSWTRPDMAAYKFMDKISNNEAVTLYNNGEVFRDFTHVSDIVNSIQLLTSKITKEPIGTHKIFNIGNSSPISVKKYAELIAKNLNKELIIENKPLPTNELESTHSDTEKLQTYIDYKPHHTIEDGIREMTDWFKEMRYE